MTATPRRRTAFALLLPAILGVLLPGLCSCGYRPPATTTHLRQISSGPLEVVRQDDRRYVHADQRWLLAEGMAAYDGQFDNLSLWLLTARDGDAGTYQMNKGDALIGRGRLLATDATVPATAATTVTISGVVSEVRQVAENRLAEPIGTASGYAGTVIVGAVYIAVLCGFFALYSYVEQGGTITP